MKELINKMLDGEISIYDIHNNPQGELQEQLSKEISEKYEDAGQEGFHLDDDHEEIYESILNGYECEKQMVYYRPIYAGDSVAKMTKEDLDQDLKDNKKFTLHLWINNNSNKPEKL